MDPRARLFLPAVVAAACAAAGAAAQAAGPAPLRAAVPEPAPLYGSLYLSPDGKWACTVCTGRECYPCFAAETDPGAAP